MDEKKCGEFWNESCWGCNQFHSIDHAACLECPDNTGCADCLTQGTPDCPDYREDALSYPRPGGG